MLDTKPVKLWKIIETAKDRTKQVCTRTDPIYHRYAGGHVRENISSTEATPENSYFEFIATVMPQIAWKNPKIEVYSTLDRDADMDSKAIHYGLNQWTHDIRLVDKVRKCMLESFFRIGVAHVSIEDLPGYQGGQEFIPRRPKVSRLEFRNFFCDTDATEWQDRRFAGHKMPIDKDDLLSDPDVIAEVVEGLPTGESLTDVKTGKERETISENQVVIHEIWVPEAELNEKQLEDIGWSFEPPTPKMGYHGCIYTLAEGGKEVKYPRPFYGPPWGPYHLFGVYDLLDDSLFLPLFSAVSEQIDALNKLAQSAIRASMRHKQIGVTDTAEKTEKLNASVDGDFIALHGWNTNTTGTYEVGGLTDTHQNQVLEARDRVDRSLGMSDSKRGKAESVTATAVSIASDASDNRTSWIKTRMLDSVTDILRTAAWYMWHTKTVRFPIGADMATELKEPILAEMDEELQAMPDPIMAAERDDLEKSKLYFVGGQWGQESGGGDQRSFYDLDIRIETYSMEKSNEALAQKQAMETTKLIIEASSIIPQTPFIRWDDLLEWLGERINRKGLGEFIDMDMLRMMGMAQQVQAPGVPGQPGQPQAPGMGQAPMMPPQPGANSPAMQGANQNMMARSVA